MNSWLRSFYTFAVTCAGSLALLLIISSLSLGGISARLVMSGSMEPSIGIGSVVFIAAKDTYGPGDVVTFMSRSDAVMPTTHRIIMAHADGSFVTRGDANTTNDFEEIQTDNILGKVFLTVPYLGYILTFIKQPLGFILLVVLPFLLFVCLQMLSLRAVHIPAETKRYDTEK